MRSTLAGMSALIGALALTPMPAAAQVAVDVHAHIGDRYPQRVVVVDRVPARRVVAPRVIVVRQFKAHGRAYRSARWWRDHGYRPVRVYYDQGRYYDRPFDGRDGLQVAIIYERDGRYYRDWDDRYQQDYRYGQDDRYDRDNRYDRGGRYDRDRNYRDRDDD